MTERTCLRCGAPYDEGATVCFTCGASIGELETPTQPVRTPKTRAGPAASEGAEERADASAARVSNAHADIATVDEAAAHHRIMVGSSIAAPAPAARPKTPRKWWPVATIALIVLATLAGGGYALRAMLASPPVPKVVTYHDPEGRFSVTVPALWTVTQQANGALLTDSSGANSATISASPAKHGQTAANLADALAASQSLKAAPATDIGGDTWQQRSAQVTGQDGATRVVTLFVDVRGGIAYTILLSSPNASYVTINNLVYQPLLASFRFT